MGGATARPPTAAARGRRAAEGRRDRRAASRRRCRCRRQRHHRSRSRRWSSRCAIARASDAIKRARARRSPRPGRGRGDYADHARMPAAQAPAPCRQMRRIPGSNARCHPAVGARHAGRGRFARCGAWRATACLNLRSDDGRRAPDALRRASGRASTERHNPSLMSDKYRRLLAENERFADRSTGRISPRRRWPAWRSDVHDARSSRDISGCVRAT